MAITKCFASLTKKLMESEIVNFWIWLVVLFLKNLNVKKGNPWLGPKHSGSRDYLFIY